MIAEGLKSQVGETGDIDQESSGNLKKTKSKIYLTYSMLYDTIRPERKGGGVNGKEHSHQGGAG